MQPNQNPYDFLNSSSPKKSLGATTQKGRIIQVAIGAAIILIIFIVVFKVVSSGGSTEKNALLKVSAAQADIIALTTDAESNLRDTSIQTKTIMVEQAVTSEKNGVKTMLSTYGAGKNIDKNAKQYQDSSYVDKLKKAKDNSIYETTFQTVLADKVGTYKASLINAYSAIPVSNSKPDTNTQLHDYLKQMDLLYPPTTAVK